MSCQKNPEKIVVVVTLKKKTKNKKQKLGSAEEQNILYYICIPNNKLYTVRFRLARLQIIKTAMKRIVNLLKE